MPVRDAAADKIVIQSVETRSLVAALIGTSPLILNRMSQKAARELLMPQGRKNTAERQSSLKHDPLAEFRASPYTMAGDDSPTLLAMMSSAVKGAMMTAALDLPGTKKAQIGRLVYVERDYIPVWGVPRLFMSVTRSADINRTPDIRTRAIVPTWAALVTITFVTPLLTETAVINLLQAAGTISGIGDWRPEKGKGSYGQFIIANANDPRFLEITEAGGRAAQAEAMASPVAYDQESEELWSWFEDEVVVRGKSKVRGERVNGHAGVLAAV